MPGNDIEDRIRILYELQNFSQGQHQSQPIDDTQHVLIYNQWAEKQRQIGEHLSSNLKNFTVEQLGSLGGFGTESFCAFDQNYGQLTRKPDLSSNLSIKQEPNTHGFMLGQQTFQERQNELEFLGENTGLIPHHLASRGLSVLKSQQEYAPGDSPTLTTNSERSEMTDASTEFNFVGGQQQLVRGQQPVVPQPTAMQQSGYSDVQLLQQHIMFKQLQEFQKQQQLTQFGDARQLNEPISRQGVGVQYSTFINGTPVNDASQMFMNRVQRGASPASQGMSNRSVFPQEQGQTLRSMPLVSQQFDVSLYGTPAANARGTMSHFPNVQGMPHDSHNLLSKVGGQIQKPVMQSTAINNPFLGDQCNFSPDQIYLPQGAFMSKHGLQGKNMFGHVPLQGVNSDATLGNYPLGTSVQTNAPWQELSAKQEPAGWPGVLQQKTMQHDPSQDMVSLDPMEEKILYNMDDDDVWNSPFGRRSDVIPGGFGNALEQTEVSNSFPSLQSGSWSALMQSAVAEASSSDTGVQEEWSGLTFQNTELSTDNQTSSILDSEKQQRGWADNSLQSDSSLGSKPLSMLNDSSVNSSFPGFHPTGIQFMTKQKDLHLDDSHESIQKSPKSTSEWLDCNPQPPLSMEGSEQVQHPMHLDNSWASQINKLAENNAHQQRIGSYDVVREPRSKLECHANEAMYKRSDSDGFPWKIGGDSILRSTGGLARAESHTNNNLLGRENAQLFSFAGAPASRITKAHQETSQQVVDSNQLDYMKRVKISMNGEENDSTGVKTYHMGNNANFESYEAAEAYGQQQNCYPRDGSHKQGHLGQFEFMGDVSNSAISFDKESLPNLQVRASEESSGRNLNISATVHGSVGSGGSNINAQTSQDMLELLPKVDQSKENTSMPHFGSAGISPLHEVAEAGTARASIAQMYNQSSVSQGFALRLSPPSQRLANSNTLMYQGLPQTASNLNLRQLHSDRGEKHQTQLTPTSFQSLPASNELSPRRSWDDKFNASECSNMSSSLYVHQSSVAAVPSNPPFTGNQLQMRIMSNGLLSCSSPQATLGTTSRYPSFNLAPFQDTSQQICANLRGQVFPGLQAVTSQPPVMSSMLQQGGFSARPPSLWTSTQQHLLGMEPCKVPSVEPSRNSMESTSLTGQDLNDQGSRKTGYEQSELGAGSINSQGSVHDEDQSRKEGLQKVMSSGTVNALQAGASNISDKNFLASSSLVAHSHRQDLERFHRSYNHSPTGSERSHESFDQSIKPSYGSRQNYSLLHQVQAMKNANTDQASGILNSQQVTAIAGQQPTYQPGSASRNSRDDGLNSASHISPLSSGDNKMSGFVPEAGEDPRVKAPSQPALQEIPSQEVAAFCQNDISSQPSGSNVVSEHVQNSLVNLKMVPSWFKQYGTLRNGQMPPLYEGKLAGPAGVQFSVLKPSQNFGIHSSVERLNVADASQNGRVLPSSAAAVVASESFSGSYVFSSDVIGQSVATVRPKKRKAMVYECVPWHKEVTQGFNRFQDISIAEHDWAQASNRLIEKVEDQVQMIEGGPPLHRRKRRLMLTTQLMQQLLCPAPAPVFRANAATRYDSVVCYVARLSLGDACSLTYDKRNDLCKPPSNMVSEDLKVSESTNVEHFSKAVQDFTSRSKKLESDLLRLDKAASVLDLRLECQELEKVSIINRFAKFHMRPADVSGTTSSSGTAVPRGSPQRYITPLPMPSNVPEGEQCLSL